MQFSLSQILFFSSAGDSVNNINLNSHQYFDNSQEIRKPIHKLKANFKNNYKSILSPNWFVALYPIYYLRHFEHLSYFGMKHDL